MRCARGIAAEVSLLVGLAVSIRLFNSGDQVLTCSQAMLPLDGKPNLLGGDALGASQAFAVAVGGDRRKRLIQTLPAGIGMQLECAPVHERPSFRRDQVREWSCCWSGARVPLCRDSPNNDPRTKIAAAIARTCAEP